MIEFLLQHPVLAAMLAISLLALGFGAILGFASVKLLVEGDPIVDQIDELLPQNQCGQCGYPGCRPYAEAIAANGEAINKCAPGGQATVNALANLLDVPAPELDEAHAGNDPNVKKVAFVREEECIGCTKCLQACPVDAILGAAKQMNTIIASECTGCDLCVEPCPVNCIEMRPIEMTWSNWRWEMPPASGEQVKTWQHGIIATDAGEPARNQAA